MPWNALYASKYSEGRRSRKFKLARHWSPTCRRSSDSSAICLLLLKLPHQKHAVRLQERLNQCLRRVSVECLRVRQYDVQAARKKRAALIAVVAIVDPEESLGAEPR